jgi:hypothetical protein
MSGKCMDYYKFLGLYPILSSDRFYISRKRLTMYLAKHITLILFLE